MKKLITFLTISFLINCVCLIIAGAFCFAKGYIDASHYLFLSGAISFIVFLWLVPGNERKREI